MHRSIPALLTTAMAVIPASATWAATHPAHPATSGGSATARAAAAAPTRKAVATRTITGPVADMRWGPVQVTIVVKGKRITAVRATAPMERARSAFINQQAIPWLRQETLKAQNANIDLISGATMTSEAYVESLQGALKKAHL